MAWLAIDKKGNEFVYDLDEERVICPANCKTKYNFIQLPAGSIKKLIGRDLNKREMPVELRIND
jgi:hypothetical protein